MDDTMYGLLYVLFTFGIPIVVITIIVRSKKKKEEAAKRAAEQQAQRKKAEAQEAARLVEALKKHGEQVQSSNLVERFKDNPRTIKAAEIFADKFIERVKNLSRDVRTTKLDFNMEIGAAIGQAEGSKCTNVGFCSLSRPSISFSDIDYHFHNNGDIINFVSENLRPLQNRMEMEAFVRAIALKAFDMIKERYTKDESGSEYSLTIKEFSGNGFNGTYVFSVKFNYTAENALYSAPAEW